MNTDKKITVIPANSRISLVPKLYLKNQRKSADCGYSNDISMSSPILPHFIPQHAPENFTHRGCGQ